MCSWLMQYTLYTNWLIRPLSWQRPHQVQVPQQGDGHQRGRAGLSNTFLALKGNGEEVPMAPPDTKNVERFFK